MSLLKAALLIFMLVLLTLSLAHFSNSAVETRWIWFMRLKYEHFITSILFKILCIQAPSWKTWLLLNFKYEIMENSRENRKSRKTISTSVFKEYDGIFLLNMGGGLSSLSIKEWLMFFIIFSISLSIKTLFQNKGYVA